MEIKAKNESITLLAENVVIKFSSNDLQKVHKIQTKIGMLQVI
jgi:hypothetical protein